MENNNNLNVPKAFLALLVFVHVLVTQYFFQNWGVYPAGAIDDQDDCLHQTNDGRVITETCYDRFGYDPLQASGHCLSKFLRCAPSHNDEAIWDGDRGILEDQDSWDRTPAQRLALRAYPIIGGMALAVALWRLIGIVMKRCLKEFIWGTHSHDYDKQMPVGFRDLGDEMAISAYVPTVPHPVPGEPPLIAANITGLPDDSVTDVALQPLIAVPLATLFPVLFGGLGLVSSKLA